MSRDYRISDSELLSNKHFPVKAVFNMVPDCRFKNIIQSISCNHGFGENYGSCVFWNDLDDYDKSNIQFYEGAEFGLNDGEEIIISYEELLYYLNVVCSKYCEDNPEDLAVINNYIKKFKKNNGL